MTDQSTAEAVWAAARAHQESDLLLHARHLLHALDNGFLNYKPDVPESAFVAEFRAAVARAEKGKA